MGQGRNAGNYTLSELLTQIRSKPRKSFLAIRVLISQNE